MTAVAVPILDRYGFTEAALFVAGPAARFDPESIQSLAKKTAARIGGMMRGDLA